MRRFLTEIDFSSNVDGFKNITIRITSALVIILGHGTINQPPSGPPNLHRKNINTEQTQKYVQTPTGIRTHNPSVGATEGNTCQGKETRKNLHNA